MQRQSAHQRLGFRQSVDSFRRGMQNRPARPGHGNVAQQMSSLTTGTRPLQRFNEMQTFSGSSYQNMANPNIFGNQQVHLQGVGSTDIINSSLNVTNHGISGNMNFQHRHSAGFLSDRATVTPTGMNRGSLSSRVNGPLRGVNHSSQTFNQLHAKREQLNRSNNSSSAGNSFQCKPRCWLCKVDFSSMQELHQHIGSPSHTEKARAVTASSIGISQPNKASVSSSPASNFCNLCCHSFGVQSRRDHERSQFHKHRVRRIRRGCKMCNVNQPFQNFIDYQQHLYSEDHEKKMEALEAAEGNLVGTAYVGESIQEQDALPREEGTPELAEHSIQSANVIGKQNRSSGGENVYAVKRTSSAVTKQLTAAARRRGLLNRPVRTAGFTSVKLGSKPSEQSWSDLKAVEQTTTEIKEEPVTVTEQQIMCTDRSNNQHAVRLQEPLDAHAAGNTVMDDLLELYPSFDVGNASTIDGNGDDIDGTYTNVYNPNVAVGSVPSDKTTITGCVGVEEVIKVTGFFCKLCRKFYSNETTARVTHCKSRDHFNKLHEAIGNKIKGMKTQDSLLFDTKAADATSSVQKRT